MYRKKSAQITMLDHPICFGGVKLDVQNPWIKLATIIPWDLIEEKYSESFANLEKGNPAKPARMALGAHIIKERYGFSDEDTVSEIQMNPYLQYFIGLREFQHEPPFDASTMTWFRKRLSKEMLEEVNDYIIGRRKIDKDGKTGDGKIAGGSGTKQSAASGNEGTLILDATCAPADIRFPTDVSLLNESREKLEGIIDGLHIPGTPKPRTYRQTARKQYLQFARNRKPKRADISKAIKRQLGYICRDIGIVEAFVKRGRNLSSKQEELFTCIQTIYEQQLKMYEAGSHQVEERIVSLHQPWVRPIVRGKTAVPTEFGAKISISLYKGYATVERLDWDAYNESKTLKEAVERFRLQTGHYPKRILADKIYRTRENRFYCTEHEICMNGPKLGRPPIDRALYATQCKQERLESGERNAVEGKFGEAKRRYSLGRIMMRLKDTSETAIYLVFLVMNLQKRLTTLLCHFFKRYLVVVGGTVFLQKQAFIQ
jgi:transposase, IS5 family